MSAPRYAPGERVRVRAAFPPGHVRTPYYARGRCGVIDSHAGAFANPEALAYGRSGEPAVPLYRVRFAQRELWEDYAGAAGDTLVVDVFEHWLEAEGLSSGESQAEQESRRTPRTAEESRLKPLLQESRLKPLPQRRRRKGRR